MARLEAGTIAKLAALFVADHLRIGHEGQIIAVSAGVHIDTGYSIHLELEAIDAIEVVTFNPGSASLPEPEPEPEP